MSSKNPDIPPDEEAFISDSKAAVLNKTTFIENAILYTIALLFIVFLIWAYFAKIDQVTIANGKVIASSKDKIIQSVDGGVVKKIYVSEGTLVEPNQILVQLDDTRYSSDYQNTYNKYLALTAMVARLKAETQGSDHIDFTDEFKKEHNDLVLRETKLFDERKKDAKIENEILQNVLDIANKEFDMYNKLVGQGIISMLDYYRAERNVFDVKEKILLKQASFRETTLTEYNQRAGELASITEQLKGLYDKIINSTIRSPVHGIVKKISIATIGAVVMPGTDIVEIVPLSDKLLVEAHISPSDIAFIHVGEPATIKFTAYDYTIYGSMKGTVEYVSADTVEEPKQNFTGDLNDKLLPVYYVVKIKTDGNVLERGKIRYPILPGMTTTVYILTGKKTILEYLLKPLLKAKEEALKER